jgi:hypothetical protein
MNYSLMSDVLVSAKGRIRIVVMLFFRGKWYPILNRTNN